MWIDSIGCITTPKDFAVAGTAADKLYGIAEGLWEPDLVCCSYTFGCIGHSWWKRFNRNQKICLRQSHRLFLVRWIEMRWVVGVLSSTSCMVRTLYQVYFSLISLCCRTHDKVITRTLRARMDWGSLVKRYKYSNRLRDANYDMYILLVWLCRCTCRFRTLVDGDLRWYSRICGPCIYVVQCQSLELTRNAGSG